MESASVFSSEFKPDQPSHGTAAITRLRAVSSVPSTMKKTLLTIVWLACVLASAQAGVILSDTFSYPNGSLVGAAGSPWTTFTGTAGQVDVIAGRVHLTAAKTEGVSAPLAGESYTFGALYASFTLTLKTLPTAGGNFFAAFKDSDTINFRARVFVLTASAAAGRYRVGIANAAASAVAIIATDLTPGVDYQLVVRYNNSAVAATTSTLWLSPCNETQTNNCVTASDTPPSASITTFALRQATGMGDLQMDNLLAGTVFSDVAGDAVAPVINCPTNITVSTVNPAGTVVNFTVTATDNSGSPVTIKCTPSSGATFAVGSTTVICTATDACGNGSRCVFQVPVILVKSSFFPTNSLPPTNGHVEGTWLPGNVSCVGFPPAGPSPQASQTAAAMEITSYVNGVLLADMDLHDFEPNFPPPPPGVSQTLSFTGQVNFDWSMDAGKTFTHGTAPASLMVNVTARIFQFPPPPAQLYDTELLQMDISGGNLPKGVMIRESPTLASLGQTSSQPLPAGGFMIASFFDVFTELSTDGGQTWFPSTGSTYMELQRRAPRSFFLSDLLPTPDGKYVSPPLFQTVYPGPNGPIVLRHIADTFFTESMPPPAPGQLEYDQFASEMGFELSTDGGKTFVRESALAFETVKVTGRPFLGVINPGPPNIFDTEIQQLDISGGTLPSGVMIRQSPSLPSLGGATIGPVPGGFRVGSFFDIFTELSLDGGQTWIPSQGSTPLDLLPAQNPMLFDGLLNTALGNSRLEVTANNQLLIGDLGQGGQDGVHIQLGEVQAFLANFLPFPIDVETCAVSMATGPFAVAPGSFSNIVVSITGMMGAGSQPFVYADFSPLGSKSSLLQVQNGRGQILSSSIIANGAHIPIDQFFPPCTNPTTLYTYGQAGTFVWYRFCRPSCEPCDSGTNCYAERIVCFSAIGASSAFLGTISAIDLFSQGVATPSSITIMEEKIQKFGNFHLAKGQAVFTAGSRGLNVGNIGSSVEDGLAVDLTSGSPLLPAGSAGSPGVSQFDMSLAPVGLQNSGACWKLTAFGTFSGLPAVQLGMAMLQNNPGPAGGILAVSDDFSSIGSSQTEVEMYQAGQLVGTAFLPSVALGSLIGSANLIGCGKLRRPLPCFWMTFDGPMSFYPINGQPLTGTQLRILAAKPIGTVESISRFCAQACNIGSFTITGETVPPPVEMDSFGYTYAQITLAIAGAGTETVTLAGPSKVNVIIGPNGEAFDSNNNGLDDVQTEMVALDLMGMSSMGPVHVTLDPNRPSRGMIEETANNVPGILEVPPFAPGTATSFFDVFFQIQVGAQVMFAEQPVHMQAKLTHKPPGPDDVYVNPFTTPIQLLNSAGQPTGISLIGEIHTPNPPKEIDVFPYSLAQITLQAPGAAPEVVTLAGPTTVQVGIGPNGEAADTDGNGLEQVPTEITQFEVRGTSQLFGPITVRLRDPSLPPYHRSLGQIEEQSNQTQGILDVPPFTAAGMANSFFDVFFEVDVGGRVFHNNAPKRMQSIISHKPPAPGETDVGSEPTQLFDQKDQPTGIIIGASRHTPNPQVETDDFGYSQGKINLLYPNQQIERVIVAGPTQVKVDIDPATGFAADTDGNGLDQVPTMMTLLNLMGNSSQGPVMISLDPSKPTLGQIEEEINTTPGVLDLAPFGAGGCARSYFDVNALIKVGNRVLRPAVPLHIVARICHKPPLPGEAYMNLTDQPPIELLDAQTGHPTGIKITSEMHTPNPPVETDDFGYSQGKINLLYPNGQIERVIVAGPTQVKVNIDPATGFAADTDGNGLDQAPTLMTLLNLMGNRSQGPVTIRLDPSRPTVGQIEEKVNTTPGVLDLPQFTATGAANRLFDVFALLTVGKNIYHTAVPLHIAAMITQKPPLPGESYMNLTDQAPIDLLAANGNRTGIKITSEMHTPNPPVEIDTFPASVAQVTLGLLQPDGGMKTETVNLSGPTVVQVNIDPATGFAADTDGDGLDQVPTEMLDLDMVGSSSLGPGVVSLDPSRPTLGQIEERVNTNPGILDLPPFESMGSANSFFDVFFEVQVGAQVLHAEQPAHMMAVITHKPPAPGETYVNPFTQPIPLLDANGNPTGIFLLSETHTPNPTNCLTIVCPSNIVTWTCDTIGTKVNYTVLATDGCTGAAVPVTCLPPSGSLFPVGTTTVNCTASESQGSSVSCSFTVTVILDTQPPKLVCPSNIVVRTCGDRELVFYSVTATDDCDPAPKIVCDPPPGSVFPVGTNVVTVTATDQCGHQSRCQFLVIVVQEPLPRLTIQKLPDGRIMICCKTACPNDFTLWCTRRLNPPILWEPVLSPVFVNNGMFCVIVDGQPPHRFYQLRRFQPQEAFSTTDTVPPVGTYSTPASDLVPFANGLVARWFVHRVPQLPCPPLCPQPPPCLTCPEQLLSFPTILEFQYSRDDGRTFQDARAQAETQVRISVDTAEVHPEPKFQVRFFNTEILSLNVAGGTLPQGVMIRESPTKASLGKHRIRDIDGGFMVSSFFDVFLEVSVDGGQTWSPALAPAHVDYSSSAPETLYATDDFPPIGTYNSLPNVPTRYANGLITRWYLHKVGPPLPCLACPPPPCLECPPEIFQFDTELEFQYSTDGGQTFMQAGAPVETKVLVKHTENTSDTRIFEAEIIAIEVSPSPVQLPVMLRESPTLASKGKTTVRKVDGGFEIASFFDIFTEVSLDGGKNWSPVENPSHVVLQPTPPPVGEMTDSFPPVGSYNSPSNVLTHFDNGLIARRFSHQIASPPNPQPPPCLNCPAQVYTFPSILSWQYSMDGGKSFADGSVDVMSTVMAQQTMVDADTRFFDAEILSMQTQPGAVGGVMIRESPTRQSFGKTFVRNGPSLSRPFLVSSFFDVFIEVSLDAGKTWSGVQDPVQVELNLPPLPPGP